MISKLHNTDHIYFVETSEDSQHGKVPCPIPPTPPFIMFDSPRRPLMIYLETSETDFAQRTRTFYHRRQV